MFVCIAMVYSLFELCKYEGKLHPFWQTWPLFPFIGEAARPNCSI